MNSWDFSWIWPLTTILIYAMIISLIVSLFMKFLGLIPKREDARRDNDSINREVFKELSKAAKLNKVPRVKWVYVKPSKYQLPKRLGKYKGHIADPRMLILRIKTSKVPFSRYMLLFIPYVLVDGKEAFPVSMPLTTKNIELYIEGVQKFGYWYGPLMRKDYAEKYGKHITQETVEMLVARWVNTHTATRYLIQELPADNLKAPTYASSTPPKIEEMVKLHMPTAAKEEEKEVPE